jgi:hypothetical protein
VWKDIDLEIFAYDNQIQRHNNLPLSAFAHPGGAFFWAGHSRGRQCIDEYKGITQVIYKVRLGATTTIQKKWILQHS